MENASNALIIAGAILIGVMVLSVGIYLVNSFGDTSSQINKQIEDTKIAEFNYLFTKYEGLTTIRAHDIVSVANLAKENNNSKYGEKLYDTLVGAPAGAYISPYYITVKIEGNIGIFNSNKDNFEKADESIYNNFLKEYSVNGTTPYYFTCTEVTISQKTNLVNKIVFKLS